MKKHFKKISILMILMLMCVGICFTTVTAAQLPFGLEGDVAGCRYWATGARGSTVTDHSSYRYKVGDTYAYCIEAGVAISKGALYSEQGTIEDPRFSWLIYNVGDEQQKQAAIWALAGDVLGNGSKLVAGEGQVEEIMPAEIQKLLDDAKVGTANNGQVANAVINATGDKFTYNEAENAYISPAMEIQNSSNNWLSEAPAGSSIRQRWDGLYEIVVPATAVSGDITVTIHADCNTTATTYAPATIWGDGVHQLVITGGLGTVTGQGTSRSFTIEAVGNYDVIKIDEHGKPVANCKFEITGPYGYHNTITTNENGMQTLKVKGSSVVKYFQDCMSDPNFIADVNYKNKNYYIIPVVEQATLLVKLDSGLNGLDTSLTENAGKGVYNTNSTSELDETTNNVITFKYYYSNNINIDFTANLTMDTNPSENRKYTLVSTDVNDVSIVLNDYFGYRIGYTPAQNGGWEYLTSNGSKTPILMGTYRLDNLFFSSNYQYKPNADELNKPNYLKADYEVSISRRWQANTYNVYYSSGDSRNNSSIYGNSTGTVESITMAYDEPFEISKNDNGIGIFVCLPG